MVNKGILLSGGGGHCHSVLDSLISCGAYEDIGIVAKDNDNYNELKKDHCLSAYLAGTDADIQKMFSEGWTDAFVTLGSVGNPAARKRIYSNLKKTGFTIPVVVDRTAVISLSAEIKQGVFVGKNAVINAGSHIGECAIINTGAIIEHDCMIGDFVHVSPGAVLCGNVEVGDDSHIGAGAVIRQGITIGKNVVIGAGSVVIKDIPDNTMAYGNPCGIVEK